MSPKSDVKRGDIISSLRFTNYYIVFKCVSMDITLQRLVIQKENMWCKCRFIIILDSYNKIQDNCDVGVFILSAH